MNAAEMSNFLKVFGNGDEQTGIDNVFKAGEVVGFNEGAFLGFKTGVFEGFKMGELVGAGKTAVVITAAYGLYRLGKWGKEKAAQYRLKKENRQRMLESN